MADKVVIKNSDLSVEISTKGAELLSIKSKSGTEFLWYGDENIWAGRAPLLFPICGGLKDDKYILDGKEYFLQKHGYIRFCEFEVEEYSDNRAVFLHKSNAETFTQFPFEYELRVIYTLKSYSLDVVYEVKNISDKTMYFSIGAHEGYLCPEGIEEYSVVFDQSETLNSYILDGNLLEDKTINIMTESKVLELKNEYFAVDALVFKKINSNAVILKHKFSKKETRVEFEGFPYLLLWTKPNAPYICIEPWCGIPDGVGSKYDFANKEGIQSVNAGSIFERTHILTFKD